LLNNKNWFAELANIVAGANTKGLRQIISDEAIHSFQLNPPSVIDSINIFSDSGKELYHGLVEGAIKNCVKETKYTELETLLNQHVLRTTQKIDGKLIHLTSDEIKYIEENIRVIHKFWEK
jgi:hypothetical protein